MIWIPVALLFLLLVLLHAVAYARARNMTIFLPPVERGTEPPSPSPGKADASPFPDEPPPAPPIQDGNPAPPPGMSEERVLRPAATQGDRHAREPGCRHGMESNRLRRLAYRLLTGLGGSIRHKPVLRATPDAEGLPWQTCHFFSRGHRLEAWRIPAADPAATCLPPSGSSASRGMVLVFPGLGCTKDHELRHARILHDLGWDVLVVDFPGHGGSTGRRTSLGYHEAEDVANVYGDVRERFDPARLVLLGVSLGAVAILRAVHVRSIHPDALVLEAPFNTLAQTVHNRIRAMGVPSPILAELLMVWGGILHGYMPMRFRPEEDAAFVSCPTLLLHAVRDAWITEAEAGRVYARLGGAKRFVRFAGGEHGECLASDPGFWGAEVGAFLRGVS